MYLEKKTYVKNWDTTAPEDTIKISVQVNGKDVEGINPKNISFITEQVGYWRKANQVHRWFVKNVQDGTDDCKTYEVSFNQLKDLKAICEEVINGSVLIKGKVKTGSRINSITGKWDDILEEGKIIEDSSLALKLLPNVSGFFFGNEDYNEYYLKDLEYTVEIIQGLESSPNPEYASYYYNSSW